MGRLILQLRPRVFGVAPLKDAPTEVPTSDYAERLVKYVPTEALAGYVGLSSFVGTFGTHQQRVVALVVSLVVSLAAIPFYYQRLLPPGYSAGTNCLVSMIALVVWAYAIGGPFALIGWHHPGVGGMLLVAFTVFSGAVRPK